MIRKIIRHTLMACVVLASARVVAAQDKTSSTAPSATQATPVAATATAAVDEFDSRQTLQEFRELLRRHPEGVGIVLKLDPSLFRNEQYMGAYPALAAFVKAHPEVAQSPGYFLEDVRVPGDVPPEPPGVRASRDVMEGLTIFSVFAIVISVLTWLVRTFLEHRRWSRVATVQTDLHNKLLDRFTSHEDLLRYVQTGAGKQFLEIAALPLPPSSQSSTAPISRILWSVQLGVVLATVGVGLRIAGGHMHPEVATTILTLGIIAICAGIGFIISAIVNYTLSRRLGLLQFPAEAAPSANTVPDLSAQG